VLKNSTISNPQIKVGKIKDLNKKSLLKDSTFGQREYSSKRKSMLNSKSLKKPILSIRESNNSNSQFSKFIEERKSKKKLECEMLSVPKIDWPGSKKTLGVHS